MNLVICLKNYIIFETNGGDIMQKNSVIAQIYDRIIAIGHDEMFIVDDFLDLGEYHAVRKALLRLEKLDYIKK